MFGLSWKVIGIALAVLVASNSAWGLYAYKLRADVTEAQAAQTLAEGALATANANNKTWAEADTTNKGSIATLREELKECQAKRKKIRDAVMHSTQRLEAQLQDANATLAATMERYQAAMRDPECLICADRPICPALVGP